MAEQKTNGNAFKEAVCIDAGRIYDSCSDKDCLEDQRYQHPHQPLPHASMMGVQQVQP